MEYDDDDEDGDYEDLFVEDGGRDQNKVVSWGDLKGKGLEVGPTLRLEGTSRRDHNRTDHRQYSSSAETSPLKPIIKREEVRTYT